MQKIFTRGVGKHLNTDFRADVPSQVAPAINHEFTESKTRYYKTEDGRTFDADRYDAMFKPKGGSMLPKGTKAGFRLTRRSR